MIRGPGVKPAKGTEKTQPQKEGKQEKGVLAAKEERWGAGKGLVRPGIQVKSSSDDHWAKVTITPTSGINDVEA